MWGSPAQTVPRTLSRQAARRLRCRARTWACCRAHKLAAELRHRWRAVGDAGSCLTDADSCLIIIRLELISKQT